jgi:hypothetical protein
MKKMIKGGLVGLCVCFVMFNGGLLCVRWSIQSSLNEACAAALQAYPESGDAVAALMIIVQSDSHSLEERNNAVWALGQARDRRALPVLRTYYTGGECDHSRKLCQHELDKAIKLCSGETPNLLMIRMPKPGHSQ